MEPMSRPPPVGAASGRLSAPHATANAAGTRLGSREARRGTSEIRLGRLLPLAAAGTELLERGELEGRRGHNDFIVGSLGKCRAFGPKQGGATSVLVPRATRTTAFARTARV